MLVFIFVRRFRINEYFLQILDDEGCTLPVTSMQQTNGDSAGSVCNDAPDCAESIVDPVACDFTPWARDRCPVTCKVCDKQVIEYNYFQ